MTGERFSGAGGASRGGDVAEMETVRRRSQVPTILLETRELVRIPDRPPLYKGRWLGVAVQPPGAATKGS